MIDGDTVDLNVDMGFHITCAQRFRVLDINTPELRRGDDAHKAAGRSARDRVQEIMVEAGDFLGTYPLVIRTEKADSFGRWLAHIMVPASIPCIAGFRSPFLDPRPADAVPTMEMVSLAELLLKEGHAVPYAK